MNEELGINAFAPLGRVLLCAALPRAVPRLMGFAHSGCWWVRCTESGNVYCSSCSALEMIIFGAGGFANLTRQE